MKEDVNDILSSPFGLVLESILGIIILVVIILSKTKFGRKIIFDLIARINNHEKKVENDIKEVKAAREQMEKNNAETIKKCELMMAEKEKQFASLEKFLLDALKSINNVKVKTAVENYEKIKGEYLTNNETKIVENEQKD